jgi:hypothetical protein
VTPPPRHYENERIAFATMHGKESLAQHAFVTALGAHVSAPPQLDTDLFGTFSGEIPRTSSPRVTALAKARQGMQLGHTNFGLASEGTFSTGFGPVVENTEVLVFVDDVLGLELVEASITISPLPGGRPVTSLNDALAYGATVGFPEQWVILQTTRNGETASFKNISDSETLRRIGENVFDEPSDSVAIMPDYRAHHCPSRASAIRTLCERMAHRLAVECPQCRTPGFGEVNVEYGVPCESCSTATNMIAADIHGCGKCTYRKRIARPTKRAPQQWCDFCNP